MNSDSFLDGRSENAIHLLVQNLRAESKRLGFSRLGIAAVEPPLRQDVFRDWLDQGFAGVMEQWLRRHEKLRADPSTLLKDARSVIVLATDYSTVPPERCQAEQGRVSRYAWGDDYHDLLRRRVNSLGTWLKAAAPKCLTVGVVDSAPLAEREFGWAAGLGWFGKNTMLIDPDAGSFFFLSALLTDLILPVDAPLMTDHCGTCTACLDACPTGAFVAPRVLDANKCISALTIEDHGPLPVNLRLAMGNWVFGCDICQDVCPWNRRAPVSNEPAFVPRETVTTLSLLDLLSRRSSFSQSLQRFSTAAGQASGPSTIGCDRDGEFGEHGPFARRRRYRCAAHIARRFRGSRTGCDSVGVGAMETR